MCSLCLTTCFECQTLNLDRYQKSYGSHCLTPPNPDLSQLLISADRNIKVLEERIPHEIGRNTLTWPLVTCSIIIFQFQTASSRLQWVEIHLENFPDFRWISTRCRQKKAVWNWKIMIEHVTGGHMSLLWPILCVICSLSSLILRSAEIRSWERSGLGEVRQWLP